MSVLRIGIYVLIALFLQAGLAGPFFQHGVFIDFVILAVVYVGLQRGPEFGLLTGAIGGLVQDMFSGGIIGIGGFVKTIVGFCAGVVGKQLIVAGVLPRIVVLLVGTAFSHAGYVGLSFLFNNRPLEFPYNQVLQHTLTTGLAGFLIFLVLDWSSNVFNRSWFYSLLFRRGRGGRKQRLDKSSRWG